jgi:hypothetical protein
MSQRLSATLNPMENRFLRRIEEKSEIHRGKFIALFGEFLQFEHAQGRASACFAQAAGDRIRSVACSGPGVSSRSADSMIGSWVSSNIATSHNENGCSSRASFSRSTGDFGYGMASQGDSRSIPSNAPRRRFAAAGPLPVCG